MKNNIIKGLIILFCISLASAGVAAQGAGGFTASLDAGYAGTAEEEPNDITYQEGGDTYPDCPQIPIWYLTDTGIGEDYLDCVNEDFDSDGCTNKQEYDNFVANYTGEALPNEYCVCDGICEDVSPPVWCDEYCEGYGNPNGNGDPVIPEFSTWGMILALIVIVAGVAWIRKKR